MNIMDKIIKRIRSLSYPPSLPITKKEEEDLYAFFKEEWKWTDQNGDFNIGDYVPFVDKEGN